MPFERPRGGRRRRARCSILKRVFHRRKSQIQNDETSEDKVESTEKKRKESTTDSVIEYRPNHLLKDMRQMKPFVVKSSFWTGPDEPPPSGRGRTLDSIRGGAEIILDRNFSSSSSESCEGPYALLLETDDLDVPCERSAITVSSLADANFSFSRFDEAVQGFRWTEWATSLRRSDPRFRIHTFFNDVAQEGADKIEETGLHPNIISPLLRAFYRASVFTVWRPTSIDAIRKMMRHEAVGKGLDIKGKSAKCGRLSGFVPFLQISLEEHKKLVRTIPSNGTLRIFFETKEARDTVIGEVSPILMSMVNTVKEMKSLITRDDTDAETFESALEMLSWDMIDTSVTIIDDYAPQCYGIQMPARLFWESFVSRQPIEREGEYETGRPSVVAFQDMNNSALSTTSGPTSSKGPRAVLWQHADTEGPMCPLTLLVAYEEHGRVLPVVSDFDCFLVGTRGVKYKARLPHDQIELVKWCISRCENILDSSKTRDAWTSRWLEVLKVQGRSGFHPTVPEFGFGDPKSYSIMKNAIYRLHEDGCVRHGAECFNYYFPQELDETFLIIADDLPGGHQWMYVDGHQLRDLLCHKIDEGYTFPLNPKWVLCDHKWKEVYDKLMSSERDNVQDSLEIWFPVESGIREQIEDICSRHPRGFERCKERLLMSDSIRFQTLPEDDEQRMDSNDGSTTAMDLAQFELKNYLVLQRAKFKLFIMIRWMNMVKNHAEKNTNTQRKSIISHSRTSFDEDSN